MSYLCLQNNESIVMAENTDANLDWILGNMHIARKMKILEIRQQIIEDTYDIDKRWNAAIDRLLENLVA